MKNKSELVSFVDLPVDMNVEIAQHLPTHALSNFALVSKQHAVFFTSMLNIRKETRLFLNKVTRGDYNGVKEMLINNIGLIIEEELVDDCSGRTFERISGAAYTFWAKDKPMWDVMLDCVSQSEKKSAILKKLISQYENVKMNGVTYWLNDKRVTESHFDFNSTIINELQRCIDLFNAPYFDFERTDAQWIKNVGGAQKLLPMHVVYEYCSSRLFFPLPDFTQPLMSTPTQQFDKPDRIQRFPLDSQQLPDCPLAIKNDWFAKGSQLGLHFAITKGDHNDATSSSGMVQNMVQIDLEAITALYETRTKDFINLETQLEEMTTAEHYPDHKLII